jgi:cobalt-zinc-cadmium efflux system outer membrane protein
MRATGVCTLAFIATVAAAFGQTRLTPEAVTRLALSGNLELRAARQVIAEAEARARGAGRLANPELGLEAAGGQDFEGRVEVGLTQWFPVTSRLRWERAVSQLEIAKARLEVADAERRVATAALAAYVELAAAREEVALGRRLAESADKEAAALERQAADGLASGLDAGTGRLAAGEILLSQAASQADEAASLESLATLLGTADGTSFGTGGLPLPAKIPAKMEVLNRPDLQLAELALESGDAEIALAQASRWQDVGVGLFVEGERSRDEPEGIESEGLLGMRVSIPFPVWQDGRTKVQEKQAALARLKQNLAALKLAARNEASTAWKAMQIRFESAQKSGSTILPAAREQLSKTEAAFGRGEADMMQIFRARDRLMQFERGDLAARKAFYLARVRWLSATGAILRNP